MTAIWFIGLRFLANVKISLYWQGSDRIPVILPGGNNFPFIPLPISPLSGAFRLSTFSCSGTSAAANSAIFPLRSPSFPCSAFFPSNLPAASSAYRFSCFSQRSGQAISSLSMRAIHSFRHASTPAASARAIPPHTGRRSTCRTPGHSRSIVWIVSSNTGVNGPSHTRTNSSGGIV